MLEGRALFQQFWQRCACVAQTQKGQRQFLVENAAHREKKKIRLWDGEIKLRYHYLWCAESL